MGRKRIATQVSQISESHFTVETTQIQGGLNMFTALMVFAIFQHTAQSKPHIQIGS